MKRRTPTRPVTDATLQALRVYCDLTAQVLCDARERAEYHGWKGSTGPAYRRAKDEWKAARRGYLWARDRMVWQSLTPRQRFLEIFNRVTAVLSLATCVLAIVLWALFTFVQLGGVK